jgi:peptidoglycan hydrolase-like protein with peptidoglycan-binding domain
VEVQRELAERGYYGGPIDGAIGPQSRAAIRAFQVDKGLPVTGRVDGRLLDSLGLD